MEFRVRQNWAISDHQKTLIKLFSHSFTLKPSYNLKDLKEEFIYDNNGMLGVDNNFIGKYVYNEESWKNLHASYVTSNPEIRTHDYKRFKKFYQPVLTVDANKINTLIIRQQAHSIFKRLDCPKQIDNDSVLHGEKIQMHFNDPDSCALNIDGTWKHKSFQIPADAKQSLVKWGFLLPDE